MTLPHFARYPSEMGDVGGYQGILWVSTKGSTSEPQKELPPDTGELGIRAPWAYLSFSSSRWLFLFVFYGRVCFLSKMEIRIVSVSWSCEDSISFSM